MICIDLYSTTTYCRDTLTLLAKVMRAAIETAAMLLRIDQIVSGVSHQKAAKMGAQPQEVRCCHDCRSSQGFVRKSHTKSGICESTAELESQAKKDDDDEDGEIKPIQQLKR